MRRAINGFLGSSGGVNGRHQTFNDAKLVVDHFCQRCQAVSGTGCVRHDILAIIFVEVCTTNKHWGVIFRWTGQNDFLSTCGDVFTRGFVGQEDTGCFSNNVNAHFIPLQVGRITFSGNTDFFTVNHQCAILNFYRAVETTVSRVILQHVRHVIRVQQVVDSNDFDVRTLLSSTENDATDTAETVDTYFDSHIFHQLLVSE